VNSQQDLLTADEVAAYLSQKKLPLELHGAEWRGACPIHGGLRDSFSLNAQTGAWFCRLCSKICGQEWA
jgi:hypothetical protein